MSLRMRPHSTSLSNLLMELVAERCATAVLNAQMFEQTQYLQELLQLQIDQMPIGCILQDKQFRFTDWNLAAERIFGFTKEEVLGKHPYNLTIPLIAQPHVEKIFRRLAAGEMIPLDTNENLTKDGRIIVCEWYNNPLKQTDGTVIGYLSMVQDITQRKQMEQQLRDSEARYRMLFESNPHPMWVYDLETLAFLAVNDASVQHYGYSHEEFLGMTIRDICPPEAISVLNDVSRSRTGLDKAGIWKHRQKNGTVIDVEITSHPIVFARRTAKLVLVNDVTKQRQHTYYDPLTGLPNRVLLLDRLGQLVEQAKQDKRLFAVLLLDLDQFQIVKYSLGHFVAEQMLIAVSRRLAACLRADDTVARVGSDEFAILLQDIWEVPSQAIALAERIHQELRSPFDLDGREVFSTTSIGIALSTTGYDQPEDFLQAADTAMHQAKCLGKARQAVFDPSMHAGAVARLQLETDLRRAIERQQFQIHYQPIVSLKTSGIAGFEALVRWIHPTRGMISPAEFIPLAEEAGFISLIDRWVLRESCRQLGIWQRAFPLEVPLTMSVNLCGSQLIQLSLLERLDQILRETGIKQKTLKLEITESAIMKNSTAETVILKQLKALGVQISIDDFGTGYSSLERLHHLPIDTLKIDRSFIDRMSVDEESLEIVWTMITLAHRLKMDVIAEGVETAEQLAKLQTLECEYGQGYYFSPAIDSRAAEELIVIELSKNS